MRTLLYRTLRPALGAGVALLGIVCAPLPALAEANPRASCLGVGSSELGRQQTMDDTALAIVAAHRAGGRPPGAVLSGFASGPHRGTSEACFGPPRENPPHP
jgi:hypothetical protein